MFEDDHSAARGKMAVRSLIVFKHASALGNAPSYQLFDAVNTHRREGIVAPRSITDYEPITVEKSKIPENVEVIHMWPQE
jgi:CRISPR-associated protein Csd2